MANMAKKPSKLFVSKPGLRPGFAQPSSSPRSRSALSFHQKARGLGQKFINTCSAVAEHLSFRHPSPNTSPGLGTTTASVPALGPEGHQGVPYVTFNPNLFDGDVISSECGELEVSEVQTDDQILSSPASDKLYDESTSTELDNNSIIRSAASSTTLSCSTRSSVAASSQAPTPLNDPSFESSSGTTLAMLGLVNYNVNSITVASAGKICRIRLDFWEDAYIWEESNDQIVPTSTPLPMVLANTLFDTRDGPHVQDVSQVDAAGEFYTEKEIEHFQYMDLASKRIIPVLRELVAASWPNLGEGIITQRLNTAEAEEVKQLYEMSPHRVNPREHATRIPDAIDNLYPTSTARTLYEPAFETSGATDNRISALSALDSQQAYGHRRHQLGASQNRTFVGIDDCELALGALSALQRSALARSQPRTDTAFVMPIATSNSCANIANSLLQGDETSHTYGCIPIIVAKCPVFLKNRERLLKTSAVIDKRKSYLEALGPHRNTFQTSAGINKHKPYLGALGIHHQSIQISVAIGNRESPQGPDDHYEHTIQSALRKNEFKSVCSGGQSYNITVQKDREIHHTGCGARSCVQYLNAGNIPMKVNATRKAYALIKIKNVPLKINANPSGVGEIELRSAGSGDQCEHVSSLEGRDLHHGLLGLLCVDQYLMVWNVLMMINAIFTSDVLMKIRNDLVKINAKLGGAYYKAILCSAH